MLDEKAPREQSGRDSFDRYRAQIRSAALASLSILEGAGIDRVYCDFHDDFVVRQKKGDDYFYVFYQVKTNKKQNHNWTLNEIFGINSRIKDSKKHKNEKIVDSFAGKLLMHTISFGDNCEAVIFQTNINIDDAVEQLIKNINNQDYEDSLSKLMLERFPECFPCNSRSDDDVKEKLKKLKFETDVQHLKIKDNNFEPIAREAIYKFSEIDLSRDEVKDILLNLVDLVQKKSSGVIEDITPESIEKMAGISITDLLGILSISKEAYFYLVEGGDPKAVKSASIIQRTLASGGASSEQIEFCSRCKIKWDKWFIKNRHILPEFEVLNIQSEAAKILKDNIKESSLNFLDLQAPIEELFDKINNYEIDFGLDKESLLGGVFSELVRSK